MGKGIEEIDGMMSNAIDSLYVQLVEHEQYVAKYASGFGLAQRTMTARQAFNRQLEQDRLVLEPDDDLFSHFRINEAALDSLALAMYSLYTGVDTVRLHDPADPDPGRLLIEYAHWGTEKEKVLLLVIGGARKEETGFMHAQRNGRLPDPSSTGYILIEPINERWSIYRKITPSP